MTTHVSGSMPAAVSSPRVGISRAVALIVLTILAVGALAGGAALVARPDGSVMHFDVAILAGSPFPDFLVPGLILGGLFGVGSLVVVALALRNVRIAPFLGFAIGCGQMIWIVVQLAIIREVSFLHPTFFAVGLIVAVASAAWGWPTFAAWRASR